MATKTKETETENEGTNLFDLDESTADYLSAKVKNDDGLYRPGLQSLKNKKSGVYEATIRFLPNLTREGKLESSAVAKYIHYAKLENHPDLAGYYDCAKNLNEPCELCRAYWALDKSKDEVIKERAQLISRSEKLYQYVLVIEDENQPDLVGQIMAFGYGTKIKDKIKAQKDNAKRPCRVEDPASGRDFFLKIKEKAGFANYDDSEWDDASVISLIDEDGKSVKLKTNADGRLTEGSTTALKNVLLARKVDLEKFTPQRLTDEQQEKVSKIIGILTGANADFEPKKTKTASDILGVEDEVTAQLETAEVTEPKKGTTFFDDLD